MVQAPNPAPGDQLLSIAQLSGQTTLYCFFAVSPESEWLLYQTAREIEDGLATVCIKSVDITEHSPMR